MSITHPARLLPVTDYARAVDAAQRLRREHDVMLGVLRDLATFATGGAKARAATTLKAMGYDV